MSVHVFERETEIDGEIEGEDAACAWWEGDRKTACCGVPWNRGSCAVVNEACSQKPTVWAHCLCVCFSETDWENAQPCLTFSHTCHLEIMGRGWKQEHRESFYIRWRHLSLKQITGVDLQQNSMFPFSLSFNLCLLPIICFSPLPLHLLNFSSMAL